MIKFFTPKVLRELFKTRHKTAQVVNGMSKSIDLATSRYGEGGC